MLFYIIWADCFKLVQIMIPRDPEEVPFERIMCDKFIIEFVCLRKTKNVFLKKIQLSLVHRRKHPEKSVFGNTKWVTIIRNK